MSKPSKATLGQLEVLPQVESLGAEEVLAAVCLMPSPTVQFLCPLTLTPGKMVTWH